MLAWILIWQIVTAALFGVKESAIHVDPSMKTFSHAIKDGHLLGNGTENIVFEHYSGPGVVTEQWFAGQSCMDEDTVVKIYTDGETTPSLDFNLYMAHGIGMSYSLND